MIVQVLVTDSGKQGTIIQEKVDVEKSDSENDVINQHEAVEEDIDEETAVARMLYKEIYSYGEVVVKNTSEKEMMDTGQYYDVHTMVLDKVAVKNTTWKKFSKKNCTVDMVSKATSMAKFSKKNYRVNCVYYDVHNMVVDVMDKVAVMMVPSKDLDRTASTA